MTRRRESEPLAQISIKIFERDKARLQALYPTSGYNKAVRLIVRKHLEDVDARAAQLVEE